MTPLGYIRIDADVLSRPDLSDKAKMLLGLIRSFNGKGLMMSNYALGKAICATPNHITKLLAELKGFITIKNPQSRYRKIFHSIQNDVVDATLLNPNGLSKTVLLNPNGLATQSKRIDITKGTETKETLTNDFDQFWTAYPKKTAKQTALKAFAGIRPDSELLTVMLSALDRQKKTPDWLKDGGQFIPYPATWLNGRRWEDETPDPMAGATREADEDEIDALLGACNE